MLTQACDYIGQIMKRLVEAEHPDRLSEYNWNPGSCPMKSWIHYCRGKCYIPYAEPQGIHNSNLYFCLRDTMQPNKYWHHDDRSADASSQKYVVDCSTSYDCAVRPKWEWNDTPVSSEATCFDDACAYARALRV